MKRTVELQIARVFEGRITDVHLSDWTVDVYSDLTGSSWSNVQVGSPYLHYAGGDGVYVVPDVGALCKVCVPGDTSPPFVMTFVAPPYVQSAGAALSGETNPETGEDENATPVLGDANMSANRPKGKPGDIVMRRGKDGNFIVLHKGGVLQLGASELAQRIYLPLSNLIMDFSERYEHHNIGGSINWGLREGEYEQRETAWTQTFRVYADDQYADIRWSVGGVHRPLPLPAGDPDTPDATAMGFGSFPLVCEVAVVPGGFKAASGQVSSATVHEGLKFLYRFDRDGNAHIKVDDFLMSLRGRFKMRAKGPIEFETEDTMSFIAKKGASFGSSGGNTSVSGKEVKLADGSLGVGRVGDPVTISLGPIASILPPGAPKVLYGTILSGSGKVKAG